MVQEVKNWIKQERKFFMITVLWLYEIVSQKAAKKDIFLS